MTAAAVGSHFAGPDLVPGLRHVEHHAVAVYGLKGERRIGRQSCEEAGVRITVIVHDRLPVIVGLTHRNFAENTQALVGMVDEAVGTAAVGAVTAIRNPLHGQHANGLDLAVVVLAGIRTLVDPVAPAAIAMVA